MGSIEAIAMPRYHRLEVDFSRSNVGSTREVGISTSFKATFDGQVFHPTEPITLLPNTIVRIMVEPFPDTIEPIEAEPIFGEPYAFLRMARQMKLDGPPDWASNLDLYPYGKEHDDGG